MKKIIILLLLNVQFLNAQTPCENYFLSFDDTNCLSHLFIDTIKSHHNIWQIGKPQKQNVDTSNYHSRVIATDTNAPYPINNRSVFTIKNVATNGDIYGLKMFQGMYYVNSDYSNDYGKIEFSSDKGTTWIDLLNDTAHSASILWFSKPVLKGNSGLWNFFDVALAENGTVFNLHLGDTVIYRFTFISDSIFDNLDGLMYDNISFFDFVAGISEVHFTPIKSKITPKPSNIFTIEFENPLSKSFELAIYDMQSKLIQTEKNITGNKIEINADDFRAGNYIYKLTDAKSNKRAWGKFVRNNY